MITSFGKYLRNIRMDQNEKQKDMAVILGVSPAFLSRVETGKAKPPEKWKRILVSHYRLSGEEEKELDCYMSAAHRNVIRLNEFSPEDRKIIMKLADQIREMEQEKRDKIKEILSFKEA